MAKKKSTKSNDDKIKARVDKITEEIKSKLKIDKELAKKIKGYSESVAENTSSLLLSVVPSETQKHLLNSQKEALLAAQSLINIGIKSIEKREKSL
jgi:hypothetical protein